MKRRIRAEEMLKASNLPPSMAQRARTKPEKPICPRALREIEKEIDSQIDKQEIESNKILCQRLCHDHHTPDAEDSENSFITTSRPFQFRTERRIQKRARSVSTL